MGKISSRLRDADVIVVECEECGVVSEVDEPGFFCDSVFEKSKKVRAGHIGSCGAGAEGVTLDPKE